MLQKRGFGMGSLAKEPFRSCRDSADSRVIVCMPFVVLEQRSLNFLEHREATIFIIRQSHFLESTLSFSNLVPRSLTSCLLLGLFKLQHPKHIIVCFGAGFAVGRRAPKNGKLDEPESEKRKIEAGQLSSNQRLIFSCKAQLAT